MQSQDIHQNIGRIEETVDQAKNAMMQSGSVPQDLRQSIETLHQQARSVKHAGPTDEDTMRNAVLQLEEASDRAMEACRRAGNGVDPRLQQALQRAHEELSRLKKQVEAGSTL